jgi:hypothetical protein
MRSSAFLGGTLFGILGQRFRQWGRTPIIAVGVVAHLLVFVASFINFPNSAPLDKTWDSGYIAPK